MKSFILVFIGFVAGFAGAYYFLPTVITPADTAHSDTTLETYTLDIFRFTIEQEVNKKLGQPEKGYTPELYLQVFPGMVATDFEGVTTIDGTYQIEDGSLVFEADPNKIRLTNGNALGRKGVASLLQNISTRTKIDLDNEGTLTDIMRAITAE